MCIRDSDYSACGAACSRRISCRYSRRGFSSCGRISPSQFPRHICNPWNTLYKPIACRRHIDSTPMESPSGNYRVAEPRSLTISQVSSPSDEDSSSRTHDSYGLYRRRQRVFLHHAAASRARVRISLAPQPFSVRCFSRIRLSSSSSASLAHDVSRSW